MQDTTKFEEGKFRTPKQELRKKKKLRAYDLEDMGHKAKGELDTIREESNYDILQDNQREAIKFANDVIKSKETPNKKKLESELSSDLNFSLKSNNFSQSIEKLNDLRDLRSNIYVHRSDDLGNGTKTKVRDARGAIDPPIIAPESYSIQCVNHTRAAIMVAKNALDRGEINKKSYEDIEKVLLKKMTSKVDSIQDNFKNVTTKDLSVEIQNDKSNKKSRISILEKEVKAFNTDLVEQLEEAGIKNPAKQIKSAKEFSSFKDEHYHVTTLSQTEKGGVIAETDVMNLGLTENQKEMFKKIRDYKSIDNKSPIKIKGDNMKWFNNLPRWKQDMVKKSADDILNEKSVIPTQLRDSLPLARNSYTKVTSAVKKGSRELTYISSTMHSGTVTTSIEQKGNFITKIFSNNDKETEALTKEVINQQKQFSKDRKINLVPHTSPLNITGAVDQADAKYIKKAVKSDNSISRTALPFNDFRLAPGGGGRDFSGAKKCLGELSSQLDKDSAVKKYLDGKGDLKVAELEAKDDITLRNAVGIKKDIDSLESWKRGPSLDEDHIHSQISEKLQIVSSSTKYNLPKTVVMCASGKDRTGISIAGGTIRSASEFLGEDIENVAKTVAKSGHTQFMAGGNGGGSHGCHGTKPETAKVANKSVFGKIKNYMGQRTADLNKFKINKKSRIYKMKKAVKTVVSRIRGKNKGVDIESKKNTVKYVDTGKKKLAETKDVMKRDDTPVETKKLTKIRETSKVEQNSGRSSPTSIASDIVREQSVRSVG